MAAKKGSSKKRGAKTQSRPAANHKQIISLLLFAASLFILAVTFIPGENVWRGMHDLFFGFFGVMAFVFPFFIVALAVAYAMDKLKDSVAVRFVEIGILIVLVCASIDVFCAHPKLEGFGEAYSAHLSASYKSGILLHSGGLLGGLIAQPIYFAFGKAGAIVTVFLLDFIFLMLVTSTPLIKLLRQLSKPVETVRDGYREHKEAVEEERRRRKEEIDIPLDEPGEPAPIPSGISEKQRKVISAYKDIDIPAEETEQSSISVEEALTAAEEENDAPVFEPEKEEKEEEVDTTPITTEEINEVAKETENIPMEREEYKFPPIDLLKSGATKSAAAEQAELENTANRLVNALKSFGVETRIVDISRGPTVTRYELQPSAGVKISKITGLADDIALNLATAGVRIEAPIPNKAAVGIEVPNKASNVVHIREMIESLSFTGSKSKLTIALGKDIGGNAIVGDISKMPHGLIAGATGSGKSVCINSIIMSILYKARPDEVKLIMVDPKVVELGIYNGIPHLLLPVVTDPRKAAATLSWAVSEMEKRYMMFAASNVRDLEGFNRVAENDPEMKKLPRIVIIVDELADLMMTAPKEVEDSINRIAAKARAAGMHLIIATQRPSVDVVTGVIKANIPSRIAFAVSSQIDSRTILDSAGAEKLLGRGDMLFAPYGANKPSRIQGCFVSDEEVEAVVDFVKGRHNCEYDDSVMEDIEIRATMDKKGKEPASSGGDDAEAEDPMLSAAIEFVVENGQASTSMLQRRLKLGYARAARLIDMMEERGIVGPYEGAKPRSVLITKEQLMEQKAGEE
ncbi:MAG: DNA translocase FtsK [Clostridia bacterium]|nr:DNA translocase FtsK [Clostridia bacterium]